LTWNPSGVIFVDQVAIPNSNIFDILPIIYKQKYPAKTIIGLQEFISKVNLMGLGHLINLKPMSSKMKSTQPSESYTNWWYLGP
jgi:hypothetical protein